MSAHFTISTICYNITRISAFKIIDCWQNNNLHLNTIHVRHKIFKPIFQFANLLTRTEKVGAVFSCLYEDASH